VDLDLRTVKYSFGPEFLDRRNIALKLEFRVLGTDPIEDLVVIERHYFKGRLLRSFEFKFGFCIPGSKNETEFFYELPKLDEEEKKEMIERPFETESDSFFFANGKLIVHNKAVYDYSPPPVEEEYE